MKIIALFSSLFMLVPVLSASAGKRGYFNDIKGEWCYEDFFFEEFLPFIEQKYRIKGEKRYRAVSGLSMGGGGTFMNALHHPELFSSACPLSASCGPLTLDDMDSYLKRRKIEFESEEQKEAYFKRHCTLALINDMPAELLKSVRWYIDCGDDDFLYEGNSLIHIALKKKEIPHEFRVRDGAHTWTYWRESLPQVLSFISDSFHQY
jgi:enterochelin esterase-like enzyme